MRGYKISISKFPRKKLIRQCDKLFREYLLLIRPHKCEFCGKNYKLQVAHILPKGKYPRLRYCEDNILLLCFPCHPEKFHRNPLETAEIIKILKNDDNYREKLLKLEATQSKITLIYLETLKFWLEQKIKEIKK